MVSRKKALLYTVAFPLIAALAVGGYVLMVTQGDNFHAVTEGEAYRSAQLDSERLAYYVREYGIKSVVNLRDAHPGEAWYEEEVAACRALGIEHYDVRLRASARPKDQQIALLLQAFEEAPRPVLIHCKGGADRTGLAAAMWKIVVNRKSKDEARAQLSLVYGHLPLGKATMMDRYFDEWRYDRERKSDKRHKAGKAVSTQGYQAERRTLPVKVDQRSEAFSSSR